MARVYFVESDGQFWLKRWLRPGYSHCFIAVNGVVINSCFHCIQVIDDAGLYECTEWLDVDVVEPEFYKRTIWQPFDCVSICKAILGINEFWILTPYQLRRYLDGRQTITESTRADSAREGVYDKVAESP